MYKLIFFLLIGHHFFLTSHFLARAYIITGAPGAGKSSIIRELERRGKKVLYESAESVILLAEAKKEHLNRNSGRFDMAIAQLQRLREQTLFSFPEEDLFLDRSVLDSLAFIKYYKRRVPKKLKKLLEEEKRIALDKFQVVFLVRMLKKKSSNHYTIESLKDSAALEKLLYQVYRQLGFRVIFIEEDSVMNRADKILAHVAQLKRKRALL